MQDLCVSRTSFKWGIPVDFDPKHVVYVWLDALTNYITGIGYDVDSPAESFKKYWPADIHVIGKDIIRFHTIYWPIFLMAMGQPLPEKVFGHPWLLQGGDKMSKSKGNVMYADDLASVFGVDSVRYFVLHEMPFLNDGIITWELMCDRHNSDLANTLGNLVKRTVAMTNQYFGGKVQPSSPMEGVDEELAQIAMTSRDRVAAKMDECKVADALDELWQLFRRANKYIDETTPWVLAKDGVQRDRLARVLYNLLEAITIGANLLRPFMPSTASKILAQTGGEERAFENLSTFGLAAGYAVAEAPEALTGRVRFGCVESFVADFAYDVVSRMHAEHPKVTFELYSADGDDIRAGLDQDRLDLGILLEPVESAKYESVELPFTDRWGLIVAKDAPEAKLEGISTLGLANRPLILPRRGIVLDEIASWVGTEREKLPVFLTQNLLTNGLLFVRRGLAAMVCVEGAFRLRPSEDVVFVPFMPERRIAHKLVRRRNRRLPEAAEMFWMRAKQMLQNGSDDPV